MNTYRMAKRLAVLLIFSSGFLVSLMVNLRPSTSHLHVEIGQPAYAQRGTAIRRGMITVLGWVGHSIIESATSAAVGAVLNSDQYVGSTYMATVYAPQYGGNINVHLFRDSSNQWYVYFTDGTWQAIDSPTVQVYQIAKVYKKSSGEYYWLEP